MSDELVELPEGAFTVKGLVKVSGATSSYISRLCRDGRLDAVKASGVWLIDQQSARRWLRTRRGPGRPPAGTRPERGEQLELGVDHD